MSRADTKKCQTLINKMAEVAETMRAGAAQLEALRTLYQDQNVDPTGTPLDGNIAADRNFILADFAPLGFFWLQCADFGVSGDWVTHATISSIFTWPGLSTG